MVVFGMYYSTVDSEIQLGKFGSLALHLVNNIVDLKKFKSTLFRGKNFLEVHLDFLMLLGSIPPLVHLYI